MDSKLFNDLVEAYQLVHSTENIEEKNGGAPKAKEMKFHSKLDKLVHKTFGKSPEEQKEEVSHIDEITADLGLRATKAADKKRAELARAGDKEGAAAKAAQAKRLYAKQAKIRLNREELDIFDVVLEFLQAEGYAETLEEAEWMMANLIDDEAIAIILGEEQLNELSDKKVAKTLKARERRFDRSVDSGAPNKEFHQLRRTERLVASRNKRTGSNIPVDEAFEAWLDEAMSSYERNRKRAAARAEARNAARDAGKTGVVPGVGYVSPRREKISLRDKFGDAAGTRMAKAKPPSGDEKH